MECRAIRETFAERRDIIEERLDTFRQTYDKDSGRWFEELTFCVLTANTSAKMSLEAMEEIRPMLFTAGADEIADALDGVYRFYNTRAEYIVHNRERFGEGLKDEVCSYDDARARRSFLVDEAKGIGWKEGSHFLRNVGHTGLAILDKHVRSVLVEHDVIEQGRPSSREEYEERERSMRAFAGELDIPMDALDLVLWSMQTGTVLK